MPSRWAESNPIPANQNIDQWYAPGSFRALAAFTLRRFSAALRQSAQSVDSKLRPLGIQDFRHHGDDQAAVAGAS
jgi:hypothetical protein